MITCLMLYYGRKDFAEESMESFLRQTYKDKKLIIVNDHPDPVHFDKEYKNVEVHNMKPDSFKNLNEKYNYAFSLIDTQWWCPWETDDIWLPYHLENLVKNIPEKSEYPRKIGVPKTYFSVDNKIAKIGWNLWTGCIYENRDDLRVDDTIPKNCDGQILFMKWDRSWLWPSKWPISLIFRWHKEGHASKKDEADRLGYQKSLKEKVHSISQKEPWRPHWKRNYMQDVLEFSCVKDI